MIHESPKNERAVRTSRPRRTPDLAVQPAGDRLPGFEVDSGPIDQRLRRLLRAAVPEAELVVTQAAREAVQDDIPATHREALAKALPSAWAEVSALQVWTGAMQQDLADRELTIGALYRTLAEKDSDKIAITVRLEQHYAELTRFADIVQRGIAARQQAVLAVFNRALAPLPAADTDQAIDPAFVKCAIGLALLSPATAAEFAGIGREICRELARRATSIHRFDFIVPQGLSIGDVSRFLAAGSIEGARDIGVLVRVMFAQRDADRLARDLLGRIGAL
jgi:hypothetical protein